MRPTAVRRLRYVSHMEASLYPQAALGFRRFQLGDDGDDFLYPITDHPPWHPDADTYAACDRRHRAPRADCSCGLYAYHELRQAQGNYSGVLAAVAARGTLQVHRDGFRAERARILALLRPDDDPELARRVERVAQRYGVPVADTPQQLEQIAGRYARPVPVDERPHSSPPTGPPLERLKRRLRAVVPPGGMLWFLGVLVGGMMLVALPELVDRWAGIGISPWTAHAVLMVQFWLYWVYFGGVILGWVAVELGIAVRNNPALRAPWGYLVGVGGLVVVGAIAALAVFFIQREDHFAQRHDGGVLSQLPGLLQEASPYQGMRLVKDPTLVRRTHERAKASIRRQRTEPSPAVVVQDHREGKVAYTAYYSYEVTERFPEFQGVIVLDDAGRVRDLTKDAWSGEKAVRAFGTVPREFVVLIQDHLDDDRKLRSGPYLLRMGKTPVWVGLLVGKGVPPRLVLTKAHTAKSYRYPLSASNLKKLPRRVRTAFEDALR